AATARTDRNWRGPFEFGAAAVRSLVGSRPPGCRTGGGSRAPAAACRTRTWEMDRVSRLSILLPVYNAQPNLEADVVEMLEVLADVARDFQLWIIDDGSLDETSDVARHLAAGYPQVRLLRHPV